jgi:sulfur-oxidizing protein SoxY
MEARRLLSRRDTLIRALALGTVPSVTARAADVEPDDPWPSLRAQIFNDRPLQDGSALLALEAPYRAEDAALVPITVSLVPGEAGRIRKITLVIDGNPSPVAASFVLAPSAGVHALATRVRVDSYTNIHAVAETSDEQIYAVARYVKAAGGCSAPAAKQQADAIPAGTLRFRQFPIAPDKPTREVELMIRHPNYSGMQMDQITRLYVPAQYVASVRLWQGEELMLEIASGISIAENPTFRCDLRPNGAAEFRAEVTDSAGAVFKQRWPVLRA